MKPRDKNPVEKSAQTLVNNPIDESFEKPIEKPAKKPAKKPFEKLYSSLKDWVVIVGYKIYVNL